MLKRFFDGQVVGFHQGIRGGVIVFEPVPSIISLSALARIPFFIVRGAVLAKLCPGSLPQLEFETK